VSESEEKIEAIPGSLDNAALLEAIVTNTNDLHQLLQNKQQNQQSVKEEEESFEIVAKQTGERGALSKERW